MTDSSISLPRFGSRLASKRPSLLGLVRRLLATERDGAVALSRVALAGVLFPHGAQHLFGWFGGYGFAGTRAFMTDTVGIPSALAAFAIVFEFFAPIALLAGVASRAVAAGLGVFLAVAASSHRANGFFMNWLGNQAGEGYEYHLLAVTLALVVALRGGGALSLDRWLSAHAAR